MEQQVGLITKIIAGVGGVATLLGSAFGFGKYNANIVKKKELYNDDGSLIYMSKDDFKEVQEACREGVKNEIAVITEKVTKISDYLITKIEEDKKLNHTLGKIEQFMDNSNK